MFDKEDLTLDAIGEKLARARALIRCLDEVSKNPRGQLNYLEIGCCFKEDEGMSTFVAAKYIEERFEGRGKVISLDIDPQHIADSKKIVTKYDESLLPLISWSEGLSLKTLPPALEKVDLIDLAFVDGGAGPADNLYEFMALWDKMSENGIIVVDDCTYLKPTPAYSGRRDYGKAQLILPFLLVIEHLNYARGAARAALGDVSAEDLVVSMVAKPSTTSFTSAFYQEPKFLKIADSYTDMEFVFAGSQLIVGRKPVISSLRNNQDLNKISI